MLVELSEEVLERHVSFVGEWFEEDGQPLGFAVERELRRARALQVQVLSAQASVVAVEKALQACWPAIFWSRTWGL